MHAMRDDSKILLSNVLFSVAMIVLDRVSVSFNRKCRLVM